MGDLRKNILVSVLGILFFVGLFLLGNSFPKSAEEAMRAGNYYFNGPSCVKTSEGKGCYDLKKAERAFKRAVELDSAILWGHYQLARVYFAEGKHKLALEEINLELKFNPENLRALYIRGLILGYLGRLRAAEEDFRNFIKWAPKEWAGYNDLAWILLKEKKYEKALAAVYEAFKNANDAAQNPWLWNQKGLAELNLGQNAEAKKSFKSALEFADALDENDWRTAYPGNDPQRAAEGLKTFIEALKLNYAGT